MKTQATRRLPPLYTHPIGSLPRPQAVRDLLGRRDEMSAGRFRGVLDDMVRFAIHLQELAGMDVVSDGEWRRVQYIREFLLRIGGFEKCRRYRHQGEEKTTDVVVRRMADAEPVFAADAQFLADNTERVTKFALPSPFLIAIRYWHPDHSRDAYPTMWHFLDHLAALLARESQALAACGIDIVQIDDPALTYYCDPDLLVGNTHDERLRREWNIEAELPKAIAAICRVIDGLPCETHLHCCHSVYKRKSDVRGNYRPLLPYFRDLRLDRVNLEFAYPATGDVGDLQFLPSNLSVGMGVVDVRSAQLPEVEQIAQLVREGLKVLAADRIALNPDCGFAPDAGEPPTLDEAYEKLCRLTEAARRVREEIGCGMRGDDCTQTDRSV
jgi:5-methyltetrahydropteroyltriglutamate--homocysteine methyltransferase